MRGLLGEKAVRAALAYWTGRRSRPNGSPALDPQELVMVQLRGIRRRAEALAQARRAARP